MSDIKDIIKSWWTSFNPTPEQSKRGEERLKICAGCEKRQESVVFGYVCGQCGCPLGKKIFSEVEQPCPLNKWVTADSKYIKPLEDNKKSLL